MKLIDKNKLLEELKKLKQNLSASPIVVIEDVESLVESLEVKEVDLEKHLKEDIEDVFFDLDGVAVKGATSYLTVEDIKDIIKNHMKLEDRIQNIKTLLSYCPHSTRDVMLYDETLAEYFNNFFNNDSRFVHCECQGKIYAKIELAKHVLTRNENGDVIDKYPIMISYCYNWDRDGEDWTSYYFDEEIVRNHWMFKDDIYSYSKNLIKFEEFPDDIWERIQNILYNKATEEINKELESAKSSVIYWEKRKNEFDNKLKFK